MFYRTAIGMILAGGRRASGREVRQRCCSFALLRFSRQTAMTQRRSGSVGTTTRAINKVPPFHPLNRSSRTDVI